MQKVVFLMGLVLLMASCGGSSEKNTDELLQDSVKVSKRITNSLGETLSTLAQSDFKDWKEFEAMDDYMTEYYSITKYDALSSAEELSELIKAVKDTIRVDLIDQPNVLARLNVLYNEAKRLADMKSISVITDEEVEEEITKLLEVYSAFNSKINTIYSTKQLQESLEFDTETPVEIEEKDKRPDYIRKNRTSSIKNGP